MENELKMAVSGDEHYTTRKVTRTQNSYYLQNILMIILVGVFLVLIDTFSIFMFGFGYGDIIVLVIFSLAIYIGLIVFLNSYRSTRVGVSQKREMPLQNKEEKEVFEKPFIIDDSIHAQLEEAMGADYVGSIKNRKYHLRGCRLAKLIKPEFRLENTNIDFFKKRKFKACKTCLNKKKSKKGKKK